MVFLRSINVGGHRTFRPPTLAAQLWHLDAVNIGGTGTFLIRKRVKRAGLRTESGAAAFLLAMGLKRNSKNGI